MDGLTFSRYNVVDKTAGSEVLVTGLESFSNRSIALST